MQNKKEKKESGFGDHATGGGGRMYIKEKAYSELGPGTSKREIGDYRYEEEDVEEKKETRKPG